MKRLGRVAFCLVQLTLICLTLAFAILWLGLDLIPRHWGGKYQVGCFEIELNLFASRRELRATWDSSDFQEFLFAVQSGELALELRCWVPEGQIDNDRVSFKWGGFSLIQGSFMAGQWFYYTDDEWLESLPEDERQLERIRLPCESLFRRLTMPIWFAVLLFGAIPVVSFFRLVRRWRKRLRNPNGCVNCDYDLTGNTSGVCPECGTAIEKTKSQSATE